MRTEFGDGCWSIEKESAIARGSFGICSSSNSGTETLWKRSVESDQTLNCSLVLRFEKRLPAHERPRSPGYNRHTPGRPSTHHPRKYQRN